MSDKKSTVEEIRERFDQDVERFSNLETGQTAAVDGGLALELIAEAAAVCTPEGRRVLDVGCGAGNLTLKLMERMAVEEITLVDLSRPMLERARERIEARVVDSLRESNLLAERADHPEGRPMLSQVNITTLQADIRDVELGEGRFDVILAAAVLHHLRGEEEWRQVFAAFQRGLAPGGSLWIYDMIESSIPAVQAMMWRRYGEYLEGLGGADSRERVFAYIEKEDTPRPLMWQLDLLREVGFEQVDVVHKHAAFAVFGGVKGPSHL